MSRRKKVIILLTKPHATRSRLYIAERIGMDRLAGTSPKPPNWDALPGKLSQLAAGEVRNDGADDGEGGSHENDPAENELAYQR